MPIADEIDRYSYHFPFKSLGCDEPMGNHETDEFIAHWNIFTVYRFAARWTVNRFTSTDKSNHRTPTESILIANLCREVRRGGGGRRWSARKGAGKERAMYHSNCSK